MIDYTEGVACIYLLCPTSDQNGWDKISIIIDPSNDIIVCDDMQVQLRGNKTLIEMVLNKRHRNLGIIQYEQYTQTTDLV